MAVPSRISIVTLGVADVPRSVAFYSALAVAASLDAAVAAGGMLLKPATRADWGEVQGGAPRRHWPEVTPA